VHCREEMFRPDHLPPHLFQEMTPSIKLQPPLPTQRGKLTEESVREALTATNNNRLQAAKRLGVGRATLYRFLGKHSIG
ncbi:MAG: sigma-54-dependent Fis family transcriptional regulator, partial [Desulfobulbaceae bacterium]|nr:sigma-54-dependent Fis family transcriptional regulator [Desulfobulbaceae bacterium]